MRLPLLVGLLLLLPLHAAHGATLAELTARFGREKGQPYAVRIKTVQEIAALGTEKALRFLVRVVTEDPDRSIQLNTVYQLAQIPLPAAFDALIAFYRDDKDMRSSVLSAFTSYRQEEFPADLLDEVLASSDQGMRSNVIRYLGRRKDGRFLHEAERFLAEFPNAGNSITQPLLQDKTPAAARFLVRIYDDGRQYDRDQIPKMFAEAEAEVRAVLAEAILSGLEPVASNAAAIAARAGVAEAEPALVAAIGKAKGEKRAILLEALGAVGAKTDGGRSAILEALGAKDADLVVAAVRAVRNAPMKQAIPFLIALLTGKRRILAVEARVTLERITGQQYGDRADLWKAWWEEYGPAFSFDDVRERDPDALDRALVDLAIEKGAAALREIRGKEPPWDYASHPVGTTALVVLALFATGADMSDRDLKAGVKFLLDEPAPALTYDLGIEAMALEAVGGKKYRRRIAECAQRLVSSQLDSGMWGYPTGNGDNSNTQYAVLGLRSAARVGVKIPQRTWRAVLHHFLDSAGDDGGWAYTLENRASSSASMTAAGVSSLLICLENLDCGEDEKARLLAALDRGFEALGKIMKLDKDQLYALYGIERAGVLSGRSLFDGKPWYAPGAKRLIDEQGRDGHWRGNYNEAVLTSFALLFLKKATAPISSK